MNRKDQFLTSAAYGLMGGAMAVFAVLAVLQSPGCKGTPYTSQADRSVDNADRSIAKIPARTEESDRLTRDIEKRVPKKFNSDILPSTIGIRAENKAIRGDVEDGQFALATARGDLDELGKKLADIAKDRDEWKGKATSLGRRVSTLGMFVGLFGIAGGVVAFVYGHKWGKAIAIGSVVLVSGSIAIGMFSFWIGLAGLVSGVVLVGVYLWRNLHVRDAAVPQLVGTLEVAKQVMTPAARKVVFGNGALRGQADAIQSSKAVRKLVKITRNKAGEVGKVRMARTEESPILMQVQE